MQTLSIEEISRLVIEANPQLIAEQKRREDRQRWTEELAAIRAREESELPLAVRKAEELKVKMNEAQAAFEAAKRAFSSADGARRQLQASLSARRESLQGSLRGSASPLIDETIAGLRCQGDEIRRNKFRLGNSDARLEAIRQAVEQCGQLKQELLEDDALRARLTAIVCAIPALQ